MILRNIVVLVNESLHGTNQNFTRNSIFTFAHAVVRISWPYGVTTGMSREFHKESAGPRTCRLIIVLLRCGLGCH